MKALRALIATDGSPAAVDAARTAMSILPEDTVPVLLHVQEPAPVPGATAGGFEGPLVTPDDAAEMEAEGRLEGEAALTATARALGEVPVPEQITVEGDPGRLAARMAEEVEADLVVVGASRKGLVARALEGSTSTYLVRHAPCPVLVVREGAGDDDDV